MYESNGFEYFVKSFSKAAFYLSFFTFTSLATILKEHKMATGFLHGVEVVEVDDGTRPLRAVQS
ncbi:hypothetical protein, partial [Bartonella sp. MR30HLJHH]|uniref:hypothetical protein n=1 Tax=Bartonella sp. MR30HLJHH TaxID=3243557 RepID=UPI0035CF9803